MGKMMKAFVMKSSGNVGFMEKPIPDPGLNDAVIKTTRALVCTSDVHTVKGAIGDRKDLTLGHEAVGVVYKLGSAVKGLGYELPQGWLAGGMHEWRTAALPLQTIAQWTVWELDAARKRMPELLVLDVRQPQEWRDGHIEGARYITGAELLRRMHEVPKDQPVAVICGSGYRSSVSASLLAHYGYQNLKNVLGGMTAWRKAGLPTRRTGRKRELWNRKFLIP